MYQNQQQQKSKDLLQKQNNGTPLVGLQNQGNTCFINAGLQLLLNSIDFANWYHSNECTMVEIFNQLKEALKNQNYSLIVEKLSQVNQQLQFARKEHYQKEGGDPVRVISNFIKQSQSNDSQTKIQFFPSILWQEYVYWSEKISYTEFLFQSVHFKALHCSKHGVQEILMEESLYLYNLSIHSLVNKSIQESLDKLSPRIETIENKKCTECQIHMNLINGFIKLPKFFIINLDLRVREIIQPDRILSIRDQARQKDVTYDLKGFICFESFHYTYFKFESSYYGTCYNDELVIQNQHSSKYLPICKILLYVARNEEQDQNINNIIYREEDIAYDKKRTTKNIPKEINESFSHSNEQKNYSIPTNFSFANNNFDEKYWHSEDQNEKTFNQLPINKNEQEQSPNNERQVTKENQFVRQPKLVDGQYLKSNSTNKNNHKLVDTFTSSFKNQLSNYQKQFISRNKVNNLDCRFKFNTGNNQNMPAVNLINHPFKK